MRSGVFVHIPKTGGTSTREMFQHSIHTQAQHATIERQWHKFMARDENTAADWDALFKFAVVRNPWARILSRYRHASGTRQTSPEAFQRYLIEHAHIIALESPANMLRCEEPDYVGQFEFFGESIIAIASGLGVPVPAPQHKNHLRHRLIQHGQLRDDGDWRSYYDAESHDAVRAFGVWEIERFRYTFDDCAAVAA